MQSQFPLYFLEGEVAAVDPPLPLSQEPVDCFDGVNLSIGIWQVGKVPIFGVDADTEDSVLSQVHVFIVEHGLVRLGVDVNASAVDGVGQDSPPKGIFDTHLAHEDFPIFELIVDRFEIRRQQFTVTILIVVVN